MTSPPAAPSSGPDRLAEIKRQLAMGIFYRGEPDDWPDVAAMKADMEWLVGEVERLQVQRDYISMVAARDIKRLRGG